MGAVTLPVIAPLTTCRSVLFDLDGTLVDSSPDLWRSLNWLLDRLGKPTLAHAQVKGLVGEGARALVARGLGGDAASPPVADPAFETAVQAFLDHYQDHLTDHSRPYPGVMATLQELRCRGLGLAVVTNKPEPMARKMVANFGLEGCFAVVLGSVPARARKPAPDPLWEACHVLACPPDQAVMVGDTTVDIEAARAAGCPVVGVTYGYQRGVDWGALHPDRVISTFPDLLPLLSRPSESPPPSVS